MVNARIELTARPTQVLLDESIAPPKNARVYLSNATSKANCEVLSDLREIVRSQVALLKVHSRGDLLSNAEADVLLKLTKVYQMMDSSTEKEHGKYDFSQLSEEKLKSLISG